VQFRRFIDSVAPRERPTLHFYHALIPHTPFNFLPSGRRYFPVHYYGQTKRTWGSEDWWVTQAWQRHLLQVEFVDRLLGELLDRLTANGLYDEALIVIAADHGGGFWPDEVRRNPAESSHPEDVMRIPLFIKAPHQREGAVSNRNIETVDLLPTLATHLGIEIPWETHGCSVLDADCEEREGKVFVSSLGERHSFTREEIRSRATLERKLRLFGTGRDGLHRIGAQRALIGRRLDEFPDGGEADFSADLAPAPFELVAKQSEFTLARITGRLRGSVPAGELPIAIAVDGVVAAVAPALPVDDAGLLFSAMLPEERAPASAAGIELALVAGEAPDWRLRRIRFRLGQRARRNPAASESLDRQ
jgi:hypothetical protein